MEFSKIYKDYRQMVYFYIAGKLPVDEAEELTNDVFIKVHDNLHMFDEEKAKLSTWIMSIAKNAVIDRYRKVKLNSQPISYFADEDGEYTIEASITGTPLSDMMDDEYREMLKQLVINLPLKYKRIANLFFSCDYSYNEIVERTNLPLSTVKQRIFRAKKILRKAMGVEETTKMIEI